MIEAEQKQEQPTGIDRLLGGLGVALRAELDQLQAERVAAHDKLFAIDVQIRKARKLLGIVEPGAADVVAAKPGPKKGKGKVNGTSVAAWREDEVARVVKGSENGMTTEQVATALGWNIATARVAVNQARDNEKIWKAGVAGKSRNAAVWKAYDGD